jgi:hypothetical protein
MFSASNGYMAGNTISMANVIMANCGGVSQWPQWHANGWRINGAINVMYSMAVSNSINLSIIIIQYSACSAEGSRR